MKRKSAKQTITEYAEELLKRSDDIGREHKLLAVEAIALRMNWKELYNKLRYRHHPSQQKEHWWQK